MSDRTEFGFTRTACACPNCILNCRFIPGFLIPADLERIAQATGSEGDLTAWALDHLLASPGAIALWRGVPLRIHTLVPARRPDGGCHWLTEDNRCAIHALAPFACSFFDAHMSHEEADRRSIQGLTAICRAWEANQPYARIWTALHAAGRIAPAPEECRSAMRAAMRRSADA